MLASYEKVHRDKIGRSQRPRWSAHEKEWSGCYGFGPGGSSRLTLSVLFFIPPSACFPSQLSALSRRRGERTISLECSSHLGERKEGTGHSSARHAGRGKLFISTLCGSKDGVWPGKADSISKQEERKLAWCLNLQIHGCLVISFVLLLFSSEVLSPEQFFNFLHELLYSLPTFVSRPLFPFQYLTWKKQTYFLSCTFTEACVLPALPLPISTN